MTRPDDSVTIARFTSRHEAEIARGFLEEAGVAALVRADDGGGAFGTSLGFSLGGFAEVVVAAADVDEARSVLADAGFTSREGGVFGGAGDAAEGDV